MVSDPQIYYQLLNPCLLGRPEANLLEGYGGAEPRQTKTNRYMRSYKISIVHSEERRDPIAYILRQ